MAKHVEVHGGQRELSGVGPKPHPFEERVAYIEDVASKAFSNPGAVVEMVKTDLRDSPNRDRVLSRHYALMDTLFTTKVFEDNDRAWGRIIEVTQPGMGVWGETPDGTGMAIFGLALRSMDKPDAVLDRLSALSEIAPANVEDFQLSQLPVKARMVHIMASSWSSQPNLGHGTETYFPDYNSLGPWVSKAALSLRACQDEVYESVLRSRSEPVLLPGGQKKFDNVLLWGGFVRGTAEEPEVVELLLKHKREVSAGSSVDSFRKVAMLLQGRTHGASINIDPQVGYLMAEEMGAGHQQMLKDYGVAEGDVGHFLPGAVTMPQGRPLVQITGGLQGASYSSMLYQLRLTCNHLVRMGFDGKLELRAYTGGADEIKSTIGELSKEGGLRDVRREKIVLTKVEGINNLGKNGYLVVDRNDVVYDLQGGSVIVAPILVTDYCYYSREGDNVRLLNIKAKHFDTSSDAVRVGNSLRKSLKSEEDRKRIVATGEFLYRG